MKLLLVMVDGGGNIPPQLAVAKALQSRGIGVSVLGHRGIRKCIEAARLPFESFSDGKHFDPTIRRPLLATMAGFAQVAADRRLGRCVVDTAQRLGVDAVALDIILMAAIPEVARCGIPTMTFVHCFYRGFQDMIAGPLGWFLRLRGVDPHAAENAGLLQIVAAREDLDPTRGAPPVRHTGVVWQGRPTAAAPTSVPRILVSLSTNAFSGQRRMLQEILDAVTPLPVQTTVTVGPGIDVDGLRVPANASMHDWLDHDEVLATASLLVGHGGHSTAMRALSFGVPQIVMPVNPMIDQKLVGAAIETAGAGIMLSKHSRPQRIRSAIQTVLHDDAYRSAAERLGESIRQRDGAEVAADAIVEYVKTSQLIDS